MPIYEYHCSACDHRFDFMQKVSEEPIKKCPECGKNKVTKLVSAAGFQLKGTGWYATDFKNKGKPESATEKTSSSTSSTDTTTSGTASKGGSESN